jgi:NADP-dependent 3-hydroxy acid dehydrogenase YdfG/acyl carrier protein
LVQLDGVEVVQRAARDPLDSWFLRVAWQPAEGMTSPASLAGDWALAGGTPSVAAAIAQAGGRVVALPIEPAALEAALIALPAPPRGVVIGAAANDAAGAVDDAARLLAAIRGVVRRGDRDRPRLAVITTAAQPVMPDDRPNSDQASLWGLARVILHEHPELRPRLIDLPATAAPTGLAAVLANSSGENQWAIRSDTLYVARLIRTRVSAAGGLTDLDVEDSLGSDRAGTILITGAFGALGRLVAATFAEHGVRRLCLVSRRPPPADAASFLERLAAAGTETTVLVEDLATEGAAARIAAAIAAAGERVHGLVHCAGTLRDATLRNLTADAFAATLAPKYAAAATLARQIAGDRPRFLLLFSSAAGLLGTPGQGAHAAASAALDALAATLRVEGLPAVSIDWGPWADTAVTGGLATSGRAAMRGIGEIPVASGLQALQRLATAPYSHVAVLPFAARLWRENNLTLGDWPFLSELLRDHAAPATASPIALADLPPMERRTRVADAVRAQVAQAFRMRPEAIDADADFGNLGLDSLMGLEIRNRLETVLGLPLPATLLWQRPTVAAVIEDLCVRAGTDDPVVAPEQSQPLPAAPADRDAQAVALREAQAELAVLLREVGNTGAN